MPLSVCDIRFSERLIIPTVVDYPGIVIALPDGINAGDVVPYGDLRYQYAFFRNTGEQIDIPGFHPPTDIRWSHLPEINELVAVPIRTPVTIRFIGDQFFPLLHMQELPPLADCSQIGGLIEIPPEFGGISTPAQIADIVRADRAESMSMGSKTKRLYTKSLDLETLGDELVIDTSRVFGPVQIYADVYEGSFNGGVISLQRSVDKVNWLDYSPSVTITADDDAPKAIDVTASMAVRLRVTTTNGGTACKVNVSALAIEE